MIIVIAGMYRSGSTFSFNIARELLVGDVDVVAANSVSEDELARAQARNLVLKAHLPDHALAAKIAANTALCICTYRKPEEAVASWMDTFGFSFDESVGAIRGWLAWHRTAQLPMLNIAYDTIENRPLRAVLLIQRYLTGHIDRRAARDLASKYSKARVKAQYDALPDGAGSINIGFSHYDPTTFFHRRHVSSLGKRQVLNTLSSEQLVRVRAELQNYVDANGEYRPITQDCRQGQDAVDSNLRT
jgi:hypothetical protein